MVTYAEFCADLERDLERPDLSADTTVVLTSSTIQTYVNRAIRHFQEYEFWFNQKVVTNIAITAGQGSTPIPDDLVKVVELRVTTPGYQREIVPTRYQNIEYWRSIGTPINSGTPYEYAIFANNFEWWPDPVTTLATRLSYVYRLPELVADNDTNAWINEAGNLIAEKASAMIYRRVLHDQERAAEAEANAQDALSPLMARTQKTNSLGYVNVQTFL
jgi:hypothetical protein